MTMDPLLETVRDCKKKNDLPDKVDCLIDVVADGFEMIGMKFERSDAATRINSERIESLGFKIDGLEAKMEERLSLIPTRDEFVRQGNEIKDLFSKRIHDAIVAGSKRCDPTIDAVRDHVLELHEKFDNRGKDTDARFNAIDARFDAVDTRFDAMDNKLDAAINTMNEKFDKVLDAVEKGE